MIVPREHISYLISAGAAYGIIDPVQAPGMYLLLVSDNLKAQPYMYEPDGVRLGAEMSKAMASSQQEYEPTELLILPILVHKSTITYENETKAAPGYFDSYAKKYIDTLTRESWLRGRWSIEDDSYGMLPRFITAKITMEDIGYALNRGGDSCHIRVS